MPITFLDHTADVLFAATGRTMEECFEQAALALCQTQAELLEIKPARKVEVQVSGEDEEKLIHAFLDEVLYQMQVPPLPFLLHKLKLDPAVASSPLIATVSDVFGVLVYLSIANIFLLS